MAKSSASKVGGKKISKATAVTAQPSHIEFKCLTFKQGSTPLYVFVAKAKQLWGLVDVDRRTEDKNEGYQRALSSARVDKLANFIDGGNVIPNSVLISFDEGTSNGDGTTLSIPNRPSIGWVIDGQHRLAGAHEARSEIDLVAICFVDLPLDQQVGHFVTINREHKGVPSSLYLELLKQLPGTKSEGQIAETRAMDLAALLKTDENSPFFGRLVSTTSPKEGQLSSTNFVRKVAPLLRKNGRLAIYPDDKRAGILNNYYLGLSNVFPAEYNKVDSIFFRTLGFGALLTTLPYFIDLTLGKEKAFKVSSVAAVFKKVDYFNFEGWRQMGSGSGGENFAADDLRSALTDAFQGESKSGGIIL